MKGDPKKHGQEWTHPEDSCQTCDCRNGKVSCSKVKICKIFYNTFLIFFLKRCPVTQCKNGSILGRRRGKCCPVCIENPDTCLAYGRGHILLLDGKS